MSETEVVDADRTLIATVEIACPLCQQQSATHVQTAPDYVYRVPGEYHFVRCNECRHIYLNPRPTDDALALCYPSDYAPHHAMVEDTAPEAADNESAESATADRPRTVRRVLAAIPLLKRFAYWIQEQHGTIMPTPESPGESRLLEVGCAHGGYLAEASAAGWLVDGIEPDDDAATRARQRGIDVQTSTLSDAALPDSSRDAVMAWMVLEHVPDPLPFVQEAYRILSPGGVFAVSVPNASGIERRIFGRHWLGYDAPRHLQVFSAARLRRLLEDARFTDVRVIHQASIRYWWGSIAAWGMDRFPKSQWPSRWMAYFIGEPPAGINFVSIVPAKLLSVLRCSGRITVVASKPNR